MCASAPTVHVWLFWTSPSGLASEPRAPSGLNISRLDCSFAIAKPEKKDIGASCAESPPYVVSRKPG
jgi:hypothetical protein